MGILFSVPVYDLNSEFKGAVSAIIRSQVLASYLPKDHFGIVNTEHDVIASQAQGDFFKERLAEFKKTGLNKNLIFSAEKPLKLNDQSQWKVFAAFPNEAFYTLPEVKAQGTIFWTIEALIILATLTFVFLNLKDQKLKAAIALTVKDISNEIDVLTESASKMQNSSENLIAILPAKHKLQKKPPPQ